MHGSQRSPRRGQPDQRQTASRGPSNRLVSGRFGVVPASTLIGGPPDEAVRPGTTATLARPTYEVGASIVGCPPGMCLLIGAVVGEKAQGPVDEVVATSLQAMPHCKKLLSSPKHCVAFVVLPTKYPRQPLCSDSSLWKASRYGAQVLVSLASAAGAAVAILVSSITTLLSLRTQRENTRTTLDVQERLSVAQEQALRERSQAQDLRDKRVHPYISLIKWAERLLAALTEMNEDSNPYLSLQDWNMHRHVCGVIHPRPTCSRTARTLRRTFDSHR